MSTSRSVWITLAMMGSLGVAPAQPPVGVPAKPAAPAAPAMSHPVALPSTRPTGKAATQKSLETLVEQGRSALLAEDLKAARDAFADALILDSKNLIALIDQSYVYLKLDDFAHGKATIERAIASGPPMKATVMNASAVYIRTKNPMRAAKFIRDYLTARPGDLDANLLDALGTALSQADDATKAGKFFADCVAFYDAQNAKLEATQHGKKRWGSKWLDAKAADKKNTTYRKLSADIAKEDATMRSARGRFNSADAARKDAISKARFRHVAVDTRSYEEDMTAADKEYTEASKKRDDLLAKLERPPFPLTVALISPEAPAPPVEVATATPPPDDTILPGKGKKKGRKPAQPQKPDPTPTEPTPPAATPTEPPVASGNPAGPEVAVAPPEPLPPRRKVTVTTYAAAFPVAPDLVVTSASAVVGATSIVLQAPDGNPIEAQLVSADDASGLALLRTAGRHFAYLALADAYTGGPVQCVGFPTVNLFDPAPEVLTGTAVPPVGKWTVRLNRHPRLGGGPLLVNNRVVGVQLAMRDSELAQIPAAPLADLKRLLGAQAGTAGTADARAVTMQLTATREKG